MGIGEQLGCNLGENIGISGMHFGPGQSQDSNWQLPDGYFTPRYQNPILVHPRPDSETNNWAKHRRHHPTVPYRIPIGIMFGSGPFYFEEITLPIGATIGSWLTTLGDELIPGDDYGVVSWASPTVGNHSFHIRVHFQDGYAPIDVQWTLEVTTSGTIFIDPINGDNLNSGTIDSPFETIESWWKADDTDTTYTEYQVCYLSGTHNISADNTTTGINYGNWNLNGLNKPLVHYGYPSQTVIFDCSNTTIVIGISAGLGGIRASGQDSFFGGIEFVGFIIKDNPSQFSVFSDASSLTEYTAGGIDETDHGGGQRMTWFENTYRDLYLPAEYTTSNNAGVLWTPSALTGRKRHFWYTNRCTFKNIIADNSILARENFNGFYISSSKNFLDEFTTAINIKFGKGVVTTKTGCIGWCCRWTDFTQAPTQQWKFNIAGSYDNDAGGPAEISYSKLKFEYDANWYSSNNSLYIAFYGNSGIQLYEPGTYNHYPIQLTRNTVLRSEAIYSALREGSNWPIALEDCLFVADDIMYNDTDPITGFIQYTIANNPLDINMDLTGSARDNHLGLYGHEIKTIPTWDLPAGHFVSTDITGMLPTITYPRPNTETNSDAYCRNAYTGMKWEIPIVVQGGSWPFKYEIVGTRPLGMVIGETLTVSNDTQIIGDDYGVLTWDNPTGTSETITIRVTDQDGNTDTVEITIAIGTDAFVFIDDIGIGSGTGTLIDPYTSWDDFWGTGNADFKDAGKIAVFREGSYTIDTTDAGEYVIAAGGIKPRTYISYPDETVTFNMTSNSIRLGGSLHDSFIGNILFNGTDADISNINNRTIGVNGTNDRVTFFKNVFVFITKGTEGTDNPACIFAPDNGIQRNYFSLIRNSIGIGTTVQLCATFEVNYNVMELNLASNIIIESHNGDDILNAKDSNSNLTIRANTFRNITMNGRAGIMVMNQYTTANRCNNQEVCWNIVEIDLGSSSNCIMLNVQASDSKNQHVFRNNLVNRVASQNGINCFLNTAGDPELIYNAIHAANPYVSTNGGTYIETNNIDDLETGDFDANGLLQNDGSGIHTQARTDYLSTHGSEVA